MNVSMNGKSIDFIELNPIWTQHGNPERVVPTDGQRLWLSVTYHGDHDQVWIVLSKGETEISRYNPKGVNHISWSPLETSTSQKDWSSEYAKDVASLDKPQSETGES